MTDKKDRDGEPVLDVRWDTPVLSVNKKYSTTIRIQAVGWWPEGRPKQVNVSFYQIGKKPELGTPVRIQRGHGIFPVIGLWPGYHYHVVVRVGDIGERLPVEMTMIVPELPKKPTADEKKTVTLKAKTERVKAEQEFRETEDKFETLQPKRKLEILDKDLRTGVLEVFLCRVGKDGKPEPGSIHAFDGGLLNWVMKQDEEYITASISLRELPRKVTFLLPDDRGVRVTVDVPARPSEKVVEAEVTKPPAGQRIAEAWQRGRRGELLAAKDPAKVLPLAAVAGGVLATILAFRGPGGPGGE